MSSSKPYLSRDIDAGGFEKRFGKLVIDVKLSCTVHDLLTRQLNFTSMAKLPPSEAISNPYDESETERNAVITKILQLIPGSKKRVKEWYVARHVDNTERR